MTSPTDLDRILDDLGITEKLRASLRMPLQYEPGELVSCGKDMFGREQRMTPETRRAWDAMVESARASGIELQLVSAYRSVDYQCELIRKKLARGDRIDAILRVNTPPGYSEHHTGRALDLNTPGCEPLSTEFETTDAFAWLREHAGEFNFDMSYPRDNPWGIDYEPWHWAYQPALAT